jgi:hypothetical protein
MKLKIAQFLTTMLFALVMGVFWGTWFTLSRSIDGFQPQTCSDDGKHWEPSMTVTLRKIE